ICVSVAMITAVFVAAASFLNLFAEIDFLSSGHRHAVLGVNSTQLQQLKEDDRIERIGVRAETESYQIEGEKSKSARTGDIYIGDKNNLEQMFTIGYDGTIPQHSNEIAVEEKFIERNNLDWKIGDTVTIPLGIRYLLDESGEKSYIGGGYFSDEQFEVTGIGEYKITAILHENPPTRIYGSIIRGLDLDGYVIPDDEPVSATIELKEVNYKSLDVINSIISDYGIEGDYHINTEYLTTVFAIDSNSATATTLLPLVAIILAIIMLASVVLIYNSFGMSLSERVRYLGMLASVGATKKQKKASVYYEGLILGIIGIPVGIVAGIVGISITLKAVGAQIIDSGMLNGVTSENMQMAVKVPIWAIIAIVIFSALTILISSVIPARKASSITPIDAIRQREEIKIKGKKVKSSKLVRKVFGYEGELANKNLKRNGRKSRVITASIALSVILFLSCNYFCQMFTMAADVGSMQCQIQTMVLFDKAEEFCKQLDDVPDIDDYYCVNNDFFELSEEADKENGVAQSITNADYTTNGYSKFFDSKRKMFLNYVDDEDFNKLCESNGIDYKKYYGDTARAIVLNNVNHETDSEIFNEKLLGTMYHYTYAAEPVDIELSDFVKYDSKNYICNLNPSNCISLYMPFSTARAILNEGYSNKDFLYLIGVETDKHAEVTEHIQKIIDENDFSGGYVSDYVEQMKSMNAIVFVLQVFVYGFIALISLITIANIINTISTGIAMRRKEFAMLKSVGTTPKGFRKMVMLESVFYGLKALVFALPISVLISVIMNKAVGSTSIPFEFDWKLYLGVILAVFVIVGLSMLYSVSKLKHDSIIETLKEEIN
ncbi:MAG: ABC transporter permease, partial [Eubacterium sp.]|nr:ABC transporter permease [Eubacterium sp.]